ncbi:hypothetical protein [Shigella phage ESh27]|nr:hypothetical protein [Shigella phage ESh27]
MIGGNNLVGDFSPTSRDDGEVHINITIIPIRRIQ